MARCLTAAVLAALCLPACAVSENGQDRPEAALADMRLADGSPAGIVTLEQTPNGVLIEADLAGLPEGEHGFHIHARGQCAPGFGAAGGHLAAQDGPPHGLETGEGLHAGDMPNLHVPVSGRLTVEVFNQRISLDDRAEPIFDEDGSAVIIHAGADDYLSQPAGDAGTRIACGVIRRAGN